MRISQIRERGPYVMHAGNDPKPSNLFTKHLWELCGHWRRWWISRALVLLARFSFLLRRRRRRSLVFWLRQEIYVCARRTFAAMMDDRAECEGLDDCLYAVPSICAAQGDTYHE